METPTGDLLAAQRALVSGISFGSTAWPSDKQFQRGDSAIVQGHRIVPSKGLQCCITRRLHMHGNGTILQPTSLGLRPLASCRSDAVAGSTGEEGRVRGIWVDHHRL